MKIPFPKFRLLNFSELDKQLEKIRELRDSYREANIAYFGEHLSKMLDEQ